MAERALDQSPGSSKGGSSEGGDPLVEAQKFKKEMAASTIIESEVEKSKAGAEEAKAKAEEAKARAERAKSGSGEGGEGPFKVKGSINYGELDVQEREKQAREEAERTRKEKEEELKEERQKRSEAEEKLHESQMLNVQQVLTQKIESLEKQVQAGMSQKNFAQQAAEIRELATELGYQRPDPNLSTSGDATIRLELAKISMEEKRLDREFKWKMKQDDKEWQLKLQELQDKRDAKEAELTQQRKRDEMISSAPQMIGAAIARGIVESESRGSGVSQPAAGKTGHHVEAGMGESGETSCPECGEAVGIGSTARSAVCPGCGLKIHIKRVGEKPTEAKPPEPKVEPEEE